MNENLYVNSHGLRLIQEFEGAPRLKARLCEGNSFELSFGVTFDLNGNPFNADSSCTLEESDALFRNALELFERGVRELVTVPLNSNQFSGLVAFAWNVGLQNFAGSSVLRRVNENRMDDAAACFGMWIFATNGAGHKQAMRGLLRRRYSESALFMGYSWTEACDNDAIALQREIPETFPGTDRVIYKTPFKDVLAVAQRYPLAPVEELVLNTPAPPTTMRVPEAVGAGPTPPPSPAPVPHPPSVSPAPAPVTPPVAAKPSEAKLAPQAPPRTDVIPAPKAGPLPDVKPPSKFSVPITDAPYRIDPNFGLKPMEDTERWQASLAQNGGMVMMRLARYGAFGAIPATVATYVEKDPIFAAAFIAAIGVAVFWTVGYTRKCYGDWKRHHAERVACQAMV